MIVIINYARSGGTLLSKILKTDDRILLLSEVNPVSDGSERGRAKPNTTVKGQAQNWYGISLSSQGFRQNVVEMNQKSEKNNRFLVVRDWSYINFVESNINGNSPSYKLETFEQFKNLENTRFFAFVRNAIDVFLSRQINLDEFSLGYLKFVESVVDNGMKFFKYEDLCTNPKAVITEIYLHCGLEPPTKDISIDQSAPITGDTNYSRGNRETGIRQLKRRLVNNKMKKAIDVNEKLSKANELLGYVHKYNNEKIETSFEQLSFKLKRRISKPSR